MFIEKFGLYPIIRKLLGFNRKMCILANNMAEVKNKLERAAMEGKKIK